MRRQKLQAIVKLTDRIIYRSEAKFQNQYRLAEFPTYWTFILAIQNRCYDLLAAKTTDPTPT